MPEALSSPRGLVQFGKYLLDEEIARGGMARVFRARLRGVGGFEKKLVVKQILPELARDPRFIEMFVEEAKTLVQMSHPHIVPVYELGMVDGVYFLSMELVDGATLTELLSSGGPLAPAMAAIIGVHICDALQYAHSRFGVVHRDISPRNVIVDREGHARLLDFGLAAPAETEAGEVFGSHGFMSPEQGRGEAMGPRSDLFSLGVVLRDAVTGKATFLRESAEHTQAALGGPPPPPIAEVDATIPAPFGDILDCMIRPDIDARPETAGAVAKQLRGWLSAAHPEGVLPELGARAEAARIAADAVRHAVPAAHPEGRRDPSRIVRTIATNVVLDRILEAADDGKTQPLAQGSTPADDTAGTIPLPGRPAREEPTSVAEGAATIPLRRAPDDRPAEEVTATPRTSAGHAIAAGGRRRWPLLAAFGATLAMVAIPTLSALPGGDPGPEEGVGPAVRVEPLAGPESAASGGTGRELPATPPAPEAVAGPDPQPAVPTETPTAPSTKAAATTGAEPRHANGAPARLTVNAIPWAEVSLDGTAVGNTPRRSLTLSPGNHVLELSCPPLGRQKRIPLRVRPGQRVRVIADLSTDPPTVTIR